MSEVAAALKLAQVIDDNEYEDCMSYFISKEQVLSKKCNNIKFLRMRMIIMRYPYVDLNIDM